MGIGFVATVTVSLMTQSSPQAIWILISHFQLLLLMPLTDAYFPPEVIDYLAGLSFTN